MAENDKLTIAEKRGLFLGHFANTGNVSRSCELAGLDRSTVYRWRKEDMDFSLLFDEAEELGAYALEDEARRRAFEGNLVVTKNGSYRQHSDILAIFLLKARFPEKYMDKSRTELTGANGEPLVTPPDDDKMAHKLADILAKALSRKEKAESAKPLTALPAPDGGDDDFDDIC